MMDPIQKSGFYYPNKFGRILLMALEEVMGKNRLQAVLNLGHLPNLIDNLPPDNLDRQFDFADLTAIHLALEEMFGMRGAHGLALRAGRASFADALRNFGALAGVEDLAFKVLPTQAKLRIGLPAMARIFSELSDQQCTVQEHDKEFIYTIHRCPVCWDRKGADRPVCFSTMGLLQEGLKWFSGGNEFRVHESRCIAMGHEVCEFVIEKTPIS